MPFMTPSFSKASSNESRTQSVLVVNNIDDPIEAESLCALQTALPQNEFDANASHAEE
jgi:hypothetical protein